MDGQDSSWEDESLFAGRFTNDFPLKDPSSRLDPGLLDSNKDDSAAYGRIEVSNTEAALQDYIDFNFNLFKLDQPAPADLAAGAASFDGGIAKAQCSYQIMKDIDFQRTTNTEGIEGKFENEKVG